MIVYKCDKCGKEADPVYILRVFDNLESVDDPKQGATVQLCVRCAMDIHHWILGELPTADVREVIEADGYKHLICPHCLSEFYAKTKAEMFCPDCGNKFFFSEKWCYFPYVGENIEQGNGLP